ncbi:MAG: hypothetical protein F2613_02245 [Actinobacteria bacterium]|uniref:Unannotated protein n=1 Tax=freshwater metagenome TaxID=449393 RepID=A0A6J6JDB8_9ZZZZ|nr:hypothetical protein [Actinomycetota bacterium]
MSIRFLDPATGVDVRSTEFARRTLAAAAKDNRELFQNITGAPNWRKWYIRLYGQLAIEEGRSPAQLAKMATAGLAEFHAHLHTDSGQKLSEAVANGFASDLVETVVIRGSGSKQSVAVARNQGPLADLAANWDQNGWAEPGLIESFRFLDQNPNLSLDGNLLFAVAGAAEFAPTEHWLSWGGEVAVVARNNPSTWERLIAIARASGGTMLVPVVRQDRSTPLAELSDKELAQVAGLDMLEHYAEIASWMNQIYKDAKSKFILGLYAYTPKVNHIRVQGVQETLAELAMQKFSKDKLVLSWLATPTDSTPGPASIGQDQISRFSKRSAMRIVRDSFLGILNAARAAKPKFFDSESGQKLMLVDASVQQQGPSYSFSKRTQRWRAYLAHYAGIRVSYQISPPARTNSVLRHKILRASYQGAPLFGVRPFEVDVAKSAAAAALVRDVLDPTAYSNKDTTTELQCFSAIHGGLWRIAYRPSSVWIAATLIGLPALLKRGY